MLLPTLLLPFVCLPAACGRATREIADDQSAAPAVTKVAIDLASHRVALAGRDLDPAAIERIEASLATVEQAPEDASAWLALGMAYHANEFYPEAVESYTKVATLAPDEARPHYYRALVHMQLGRIEEAVDAMREAAQLADGFAPPQWRLGQLLLDAGRPDEAETAFEAALAIDPESEAAWIGLGRVALQARQDEKAAEHFQHARDLGQANADYASRLLGTTLQRLGNEAAARLALAGAGEVSPIWNDAWQADLNAYRDSFGFRSRTAEKLLSKGRTAEGVALLEKLRAERPDHLETLINLGAGYGALGRFQEAAATLESFLAERPRHAPSRENLARAYLQLMRLPGEDREARWQAALDQVDQAIEIAPQRATAYGLRADVMFLAERFEEAAAAYALAAEKGGRDPRWAAAEARMRLRLEDWPRAIDLLEDVTERAPNHAEAWRNLGIAQARLGHVEAARTALQTALKLAPDDREAQMELDGLGTP